MEASSSYSADANNFPSEVQPSHQRRISRLDNVNKFQASLDAVRVNNTSNNYDSGATAASQVAAHAESTAVREEANEEEDEEDRMEESKEEVKLDNASDENREDS